MSWEPSYLETYSWFLRTDFISHLLLPSAFPVLVAFTTIEYASSQKVVQPVLKFCDIYKWTYLKSYLFNVWVLKALSRF